MEDKEIFKSYRWNGDTGSVAVGYEKSSEEEREKAKKELDKILKDRGIK